MNCRPGERDSQGHPVAMPSDQTGLRIRYEMALKRVSDARLIGWPALEQSWQVDLLAVTQRMRELGVEIKPGRKAL